MNLVTITCPSCYEEFAVMSPSLDEVPSDVDYDCEVCCRPLRIQFWEEDGEVMGYGAGLGE